MFKFKSKEAYWTKFSSYQSFQSVEELNAAVKQFQSVYDLTDAIKAVLNTIKLHSKQIFGVCWMKKERIAEKAKVSMSTVDRAIKGLKETGFLTVKPFKHTKFGRQTHNVYILNPIFEVPQDAHSIVTDDAPLDVANEVAQEDFKEGLNVDVPTVCELSPETHKNPDTNPNKTLKDYSNKEIDALKNVPKEFITLMEPFYANNPEIIHARWKTVRSAVKRNCVDLSYTSWDSIGQAWKDTVRYLKRGKIKDTTNDGIGGYFYGVLCDYLFNDFLRNGSVRA